MSPEAEGTPPKELTEQDELAQARDLLQDPAQVAPVDPQKFGRGLSEILTRALRLPRKSPR
jgi:hypothetical protein